ncbi:hypothetical protein BMR07_18625, partial [Methylococcaceae bacterium CS1]
RLSSRPGLTATERSKLDKSKTSSESKALHYVLSGLVDMGQERVLSVDMLADKVYSRYDENITAGAIRTRRMKIVSACAEINNLGYWSYLPSKTGKNTVLTVKRRRRKTQ